MDTGYLWPGLGFVGGFVGSYVGSYLKKKGENLATREDIEGLVEQVSAVTTATKNIEAKISGELWDRQKRWEIKRDVHFEAVRKLASLEDSLLDVYAVVKGEALKAVATGEAWVEKKAAAYARWNAALAAFDEARLLVRVTCGDAVVNAFGECRDRLVDVGVKVMSGKFEAFEDSRDERTRLRVVIGISVRRELGVDVEG